MIKIKSGIGYDLHKLRSGNSLYIGGIKVSDKYSFIAHSDGDVLIHALIDSLTGAMGEGDIGELFPNTDNTFKDINSRVLLDKTKELLCKNNFEIMNIDCVIISEYIKISPYKLEIRKNISSILNIDIDAFNLKGKTKEGIDDPVGRGDAIECFCMSMIRYRG